MTNSVTQSELEDVLAAIRRLVAEDRTSPVERPRESDDARARDKLVLTPALRVHDGPSQEGTERESAVPDTREEHPAQAARQAEVDTPAPEGPVRGADHADTATEEAAPGLAPDQAGEGGALPDSGRDVSDEGWAGDPQPGAEAPLQAEAPEPQMTPDMTSEPGTPADDIKPTEPGEDPQANTVDAVESRPLDATSWADAGEEPAPLNADADKGDAGQQSAGAAAAAESLPPQQGDGAEPAAGVTGRTVSLENKIAELEAMVGMHGGWEADEGDEPPFTAQGGPEVQDDEDAAHPAERSDAAPEFETAVLDEEMLRDLVAEIVRQELQGELGERITRNVRKLVRREIHRALTAQLFD